MAWAWVRKCGASFAIAAVVADEALRLPTESLEGAGFASSARSHVRVGRDVARLARQGLQLSAPAAVAPRARRAVVLAHEPGAVAIGAIVTQRQSRGALAAVSASRANLWFNSCLATQIPGGAASVAPWTRLPFGFATVSKNPKRAGKGEIGSAMLREAEAGRWIGSKARYPPAKWCGKVVDDAAVLDID